MESWVYIKSKEGNLLGHPQYYESKPPTQNTAFQNGQVCGS